MAMRRAAGGTARALATLAALTFALCVGGCADAAAAQRLPDPAFHAAHPCADPAPETAWVDPESPAHDAVPDHAAHCCAAAAPAHSGAGWRAARARPDRPPSFPSRPGHTRGPPAPPPRAA